VPELLCDGAELRVERQAGSCKTTVRFIGTGSAPAALAIDGPALPQAMHGCGSGESRAMRLGPGEWLVIGWPCPPPERLDPALFAVDVSDGLACFGIRGSLARALLAAASSVDFDPTVFPPATAMRTRFARTSAIVECVGEDSFIVYAERSVESYVTAWLAEVAPRVAAAG
jgi:heterotetrameric sarcosine oxidase gamma subunit